MSIGDPRSLTSVIIPGCTPLEPTRQGIAALRRYTRAPWELVVIDNGSTDEAAAYLAGLQSEAPIAVRVIANAKARGMSAGINQGLEAARGEYLVLLGNDVVVTDGWLEQLIGLVNAGGGGRAWGPKASSGTSAIAEGRPSVDGSAGSGDPRTALEALAMPAGRPAVELGAASGDPRTALCSLDGGFRQDGERGAAVSSLTAAGRLLPTAPMLTARPIGLVGPMFNHGASPQSVGAVPYHDLLSMHEFARRWREEHRGRWFTVGRLSGACLLMTREVYQAIGGVDEQSGAEGWESDLAYRAQKAGFVLAVAHDLFVHRETAWIDGWKRAAASWDQVPGFFDFAAVYDAAVVAGKDGDIFVEVGCLAGRSTCYLATRIRDSGKDITLYAVDPCTGSPSDSTGRVIAPAVGGTFAGILHRNILGCGLEQIVVPVVTTSVRAAQLFADESIAFCFIDADHSYEGVTADLQAWWPKVRPGGMLAGHDDRRPAPRLAGLTPAVHEFFGVQDAAHPAMPGCWGSVKRGGASSPAASMAAGDAGDLTVATTAGSETRAERSRGVSVRPARSDFGELSRAEARPPGGGTATALAADRAKRPSGRGKAGTAKILFASVHSILDFSNGASVASLDTLQGLAARGFECQAFCTATLDVQTEAGLEKMIGDLREPFEVHPSACGDDRARILYARRGRVPITFVRDTVVHGTEPSAEEVETVLRFFAKFLDAYRPGVLLTYGGDAVSQGMIAIARRRGIPVVFAIHNFGYGDSRHFANVDQCIVPSEFASRYYREKLGLDCRVLPNPIDWKRVQVDDRQPRYVTFVNPALYKGAYPFVRIAQELGRRRPDIPLLVVESRATRQTLGACGLRTSDHPDVQIMPVTTDPRRFWRLTRILLMPSLWWETQGLVAIEAMINGIPVIGSDRGALPETLAHGGITLPLPERLTPTSELLPSAEEVEPWVAAIIRLWDDRAWYDDWSTRARGRAAQWHPDRLMPLYEEFFGRVAKRRGAS